MDIAEGECSIDGSSSAALSSENFPHFACWSCFACKKLNIISNSEAFGRVVKIRDPKTFLAWPVHLYPNGLKLLVSAGPSKCLGHFPQVPWKSWKIYVCKEHFWEKMSIIVMPTFTTRRRSGTCTPIAAQSVPTNTWMLLQKNVSMLVKLSHRPVQKTSHHSLLVSRSITSEEL